MAVAGSWAFDIFHSWISTPVCDQNTASHQHQRATHQTRSSLSGGSPPAPSRETLNGTFSPLESTISTHDLTITWSNTPLSLLTLPPLRAGVTFAQNLSKKQIRRLHFTRASPTSYLISMPVMHTPISHIHLSVYNKNSSGIPRTNNHLVGNITGYTNPHLFAAHCMKSATVTTRRKLTDPRSLSA